MNSKIKTALGVGAMAAMLATGVYVGEALASQPHMDAALSDLRAAKSELEQASHNKGGHRLEALRLTQLAIDETKRGIDSGE